MKFSRVASAFVVATALAAGSARAAGVIDTYDPATDPLFTNNGTDGVCTGTNNSPDPAADSFTFAATKTSCSTLTFWHTLTGYDNSAHTLTSATLTLYFYDDNTPAGDVQATSEVYNLRLEDEVALFADDQTIDNASTEGAGEFDSPAFNVLARVETDGLLKVVVGWDQGDFFFERSVLNAQWTVDTTGGGSDVTPVPEPASMALLGTGLAAVAIRRRRTRARV